MKISKQVIASAKELIDLIGADDVQEVEIERKLFGRGRIRIVRASKQAPIVQALTAPPASASAPVDVSETQVEDAASGDDGHYHTLRSPMVGMFYQSPNPEAPPYAAEGDEVTRGQTLCIIEAMKIMNEIECDVDGRVVRVLVENAAPVEYNTPLFLIDPEK
ncbi:MAG: acetyl-CoA carboxylase biotin carboxyl carrier protein [Gemmatimonadetes bacterium]|nr:acetyl-CoA carboxylase biotin carboxyl carrier protein [Gemmatimonadota bacterium]